MTFDLNVTKILTEGGTENKKAFSSVSRLRLNKLRATRSQVKKFN